MEQNKLTLGSLFDGSGGFPLGGLISGIVPLWASEIEPFPIRVTTKRMPFMKHYGDVSVLNGAELPPVDIITFGSPCQDMSLAGKREGLDGNRSGLFYEAVRIVKEMRVKTNGKYPRYIVWENVHGAFSSNKGEDFRCVLESICHIADETVSVPSVKKWQYAGEIVGDGYSVAWRLLDAQYWGVPQRRRRIYLVADLAGGCAGKILFESEGLSGYTPQGFRSWQGSAGGAEEGAHPAGVGTDGYNGAVSEVAATLGVNCGMSTGRNGVMVLNDQGGNRMDVTEEVTSTLRAEAHHPPCVMESAGFRTEHSEKSRVEDTPKTLKIRSGCEGGGKGALIQDDKSATLGTHNDQTLFQPKVYGICSKDSNSMKSDNPKSGFYEADTSRTLDGRGGNPSCNQGGMAVVAKGPGAVAEPTYSSSRTSFFTEAAEELASTLMATDYKDPPLINDKDEAEYIVRRLTPTECARLQGFPDWWCGDLGTGNPTEEEMRFWRDVFETHRMVVTGAKKPKTDNQIRKWLKDPYSDSAAYKLWGNGVALPCVHFVLAGIVYYSQFESGGKLIAEVKA